MKRVLFMSAVLMLAVPAMAQHDRFNDPDYPGTTSKIFLMSHEEFCGTLPVPVDRVRDSRGEWVPCRGRYNLVPVVDEDTLDHPYFGWVIDQLRRTKQFGPVIIANHMVRSELDLLTVSCQPGTCYVELTNRSHGGLQFSIRVPEAAPEGHMTSQIWYIGDERTKGLFLIRLLQPKTHR